MELGQFEMRANDEVSENRLVGVEVLECGVEILKGIGCVDRILGKIEKVEDCPRVEELGHMRTDRFRPKKAKLGRDAIQRRHVAQWSH